MKNIYFLFRKPILLILCLFFLGCDSPFDKVSNKIKFNGYNITLKRTHDVYKIYDASWNNTYMYIELYKDTLLQWEYEKAGLFKSGAVKIPTGVLKGNYGSKGDTFVFVDYSFN
jgi:hypothetical protein